jgi:hypothetical protein
MWMSVLKRIGLLVLALLVGGVAGFGLVWLLQNGWFEGYARVAAAPEPVARIRLINQSEVWVEAESGALYHNPAADTCVADCWFPVVELPAAPALDDEVREVFTAPCVAPPPALGAVERMAECQRAMWWDWNTVYARQRSGDLRVWRFTSGGEYSFLLYPLGGIFGAVVLFGLALVIIVIEAVWRALSRRRAAARAEA